MQARVISVSRLKPRPVDCCCRRTWIVPVHLVAERAKRSRRYRTLAAARRELLARPRRPSEQGGISGQSETERLKISDHRVGLKPKSALELDQGRLKLHELLVELGDLIIDPRQFCCQSVHQLLRQVGDCCVGLNVDQ